MEIMATPPPPSSRTDQPPDQPRSHALAGWIGLVLLVLVLGLLFHRLLLGEALFWGLPSLQFQPWRSVVLEALRQGQLPLWNPYSGGGAPLLANYQSAVFYPPNWLFWFDASPRALGWSALLHVVIAGVGMWMLGRRWGLHSLAQGLMTLSYPLSGTLIARFGTLPMIAVAAWLPWLIWATEGLLARPSLHSILILGLVAALQLLAGHAQWTFYSLLLAGGLVLWRIGRQHVPWTRLILFGCAIVLAGMLAAVQLLPTAELQRNSQRADRLDERFALNFSFAPVSLLTLVNPDLYGNPGDGSYFIGGAYFETAAYLGFLPFLLALIALWRVIRRRHRHGASMTMPALPIGYFALVGGVSLLLATGQYTPLYPLLFRYVPTFNLFQAPARWLLLTVFAFSSLAAFAAMAWEPTVKLKRVVRLGIGGAVGIALSAWIGGQAIPALGPLASGVVRIGITGGVAGLLLLWQPKRASKQWNRWQMIVLVVVALDLGWSNRLSNPTLPVSFYESCPTASQLAGRTYWTPSAEQTVFDRYLDFQDYRIAQREAQAYRCSGLPNLPLLDRRASYNNFDPLRPAWFESFARALDANPSPAMRQAAGIAQMQLSATDVRSVEVSRRVWMVNRVTLAADPTQALAMIQAPQWDPYEQAVVEAATLPAIPPATVGTATIVAEGLNEITIAVDTSAPQFLVVADTYYPDWQATLDMGETVPIWRTNGAFRGMLVPAGTYTVRLSYTAPASLRLGAAISAGALLLIIVLGVSLWIAGLRNARSTARRAG